MTASLQIRLLGGLFISQDGKPIEGFVSNKVPALLAYLALTRRAHMRDALAAFFWGEMAEANAKTNLRQALANLRKLLGDYLIITRDSVEFNFDTPYILDVEQFEAKLHVDNPSDAVALYRGDFLDGVFVCDAPEFEEWAIAQRARLRELALQAMHALVTHYSTRGDYARGMDYATRLLALDAWREETHRALMLMLARSGQRSVALEQYEICKRVLAEEMGVPPSAETTTLYERIRAAGDAPRHNLPPQPTSFVGRAQELGQVETFLLKRDSRLITLLGAGGIGKTRLALEAAERALKIGAFLNGVFFVPLAGVDSPALLAPAIADACGFTFSGKQDPQTQLANFLREKEILIVLDNFEHLLDAATWLSQLLNHAPNVKLLITSRERLNLQREWLVAVEGLDYPKVEGRVARRNAPREESSFSSFTPALAVTAGASVPHAERSSFASVQLFIERARQVRPDFELNDATRAGVARVCQLVEGMPLGIELAAAWAQTHSADEIARAIERGYDFLATMQRDAPERQRSLRAVFDQSWQLLSAPERVVFQRLAVFRGGFTRDAAECVANAARAILSALVDKSFLRSNASGRYEMHELLRQYAEEKLSALPDAHRAARHAHSAYFAAFIRDCSRDLDGRRQVEALARISGEAGNVHSAWQFALERHEIAHLQLACQGLFQYYLTRGDYHSGRALFEAAMRAFKDDDANINFERSFVLARLMTRLGQFYHRLGMLDEAESILTRAMAMLPEEAPDLAQEKSTALNAFGLIALYRGELDQARHYFHESREFAEQAQMRSMQLTLANNLAIVAGMQGDFAEAYRQFSQAAGLCEKIGDVRRMLAVVMNGGVAAHYLPDLVEAKRLLTQASELARKLQDRENLALALSNLASVAIDAGELDIARVYLDEALALVHVVGSAYVQSAVLEEVARLELASGNVDQANAQALAALRAATDHRLVDPQLHALVTLATIRRAPDAQAAARIIAMVERHPARLSTVQSRMKPVMRDLSGASLERARTWAMEVNFDE